MGILSYTYNAAKRAFKKNPNPGAAIKSVKTNVPKGTLAKLQAANKIATARLRGAQAELRQTEFEAANKAFKKDDPFTFDPAKKNVPKKSEEKAKGGRVGYKKGTPNPFLRKSNKKKIEETFKATTPFMVKKKEDKKRMSAKKGSPDPKKKKKFPDLTGDGKVTFADILKGRGVINGKKKTKKKII